MGISIREASAADWPQIWRILEPVFRAGETYTYAPEITEQQSHHAWMEIPARTFVCNGPNGELVGTYYLKANQPGPGSHVCNCGYVVSSAARGLGVASAMCRHSQEVALATGFRSMQFNLVVSTNEGAVRLWRQLGFSVVGIIPEAFKHPTRGYVDAFVMFKHLHAPTVAPHEPQRRCSPMYGLIGSFNAASGKRDELIAILLSNVEIMPGCRSYVVAEDPTDPQTIWVTEVWDDEASHKASLQLAAVKAAVAKAMPLIASFGEHRELRVIGGYGLAR